MFQQRRDSMRSRARRAPAPKALRRLKRDRASAILGQRDEFGFARYLVEALRLPVGLGLFKPLRTACDEVPPDLACPDRFAAKQHQVRVLRSEEHTSELQSLMRISYAVFCLKNKKNKIEN